MKLSRVLPAIFAILTWVGYLAERETAGRLTREISAHQTDDRVLADLRARHAALEKRQESTGSGESLLGASRITRGDLGGSSDEATFATASPLTWIPAASWRNSGRATPKAAFESILWAGANGDVEAVARAIDLGGTARADAEKILDGLPESSRQAVGGPQQLEALLIARDSPTQAVELYDVEPNGANGAVVSALGVDKGGAPRFLLYFFESSDRGWLLRSAGPMNIARYVQELAARPPAP